MYILSTGCQWRYIPKDRPPRSTVNDYFCLWSYNGTLEKIHDALYVKCREQAEREASPTACIIDSQSVKSAEKRGLDRSTWVRRRQADQGREASRSRRQAGAVAARAGDTGRCTRSRWRTDGSVHLVRAVPVSQEAICRCRLHRPGVSRRFGARNARPDNRNRPTVRSRQGLCRSSPTPDHRANNRLAQPLPLPRQRLGNHNHNALAFVRLASIRLMLRMLCKP